MRVLEAAGAGRPPLVVVFENGDAVMAGLRELARSHDIAGAHFTAIGAFQRATIAYFDWDARDYLEIPVEENVEVAPLVGNIGTNPDGEVIVHAHCTLGRRDGSTLAGHLVEATVRPTLEVFVQRAIPPLTRRLDPESGLFLIRPD